VVLGSVLAAIMVLALVSGPLPRFLEARALGTHGVQTTAIVGYVRVGRAYYQYSSIRSGSVVDPDQTKVIYSYAVNGVNYKGVSGTTVARSRAESEYLTITYLPEQPSISSADPNEDAVNAGTTCAALGACILFLAFLGARSLVAKPEGVVSTDPLQTPLEEEPED